MFMNIRIYGIDAPLSGGPLVGGPPGASNFRKVSQVLFSRIVFLILLRGHPDILIYNDLC